MTVLDTHAFIWYALDDERLPATFRDELEQKPSEVFLPSICIWEAMILATRGRLDFGSANPEKVLRRYLQACGFVEAPLTAEIAILSRTLRFAHEDPADRFIAATAFSMNARLATSDRLLRELPWITCAY